MIHHANGLHKLLVSQGWDPEKIEQHLTIVKNNFEGASLEPIEKEMLRYAVKLTKDPSTIDQDDVQRLKNLGCSDLAIHDLCLIVSYFNFVNRVADGLGVELEEN